MELWDFLECAAPAYVALAMLAVWTALGGRTWRVHAPVAWIVGTTLTTVWWCLRYESEMPGISRLLEVAIESAITVTLPLVPATVAIALPKQRGTLFWRIAAWSGAIAIAFPSLITALVIHGWMTGDWL
jgi:hypothetical protein